MAGRGFRGTDARIRFSADVSPLRSAGRTISQIFNIIADSARAAERSGERIEKAMERVANRQAQINRLKEEGSKIQIRGAEQEARLTEQLLQANEKLARLYTKFSPGGQDKAVERARNDEAKKAERLNEIRDKGARDTQAYNERQLRITERIQRAHEMLNMLAARNPSTVAGQISVANRIRQWTDQIQYLNDLQNRIGQQNQRRVANQARLESNAAQDVANAQQNILDVEKARQGIQAALLSAIRRQESLVGRLAAKLAGVKSSVQGKEDANKADIARATDKLATAQKVLNGLQQASSAIMAGQNSKLQGLIQSLFKAGGATLLLRAGLIGIGIAMAAAFYTATKGAVKMELQLQTVRATFQGLLGELEAANKVINDAFAQSLNIPVDPQQLLEGARSMLAVGAKVQELSQDLRALSVIATVANQPMEQLSVIYGEILNKNRLYREDLLQFSRRGIPLMDKLSKITGKTREELDELVSMGGVKFETFQAAMRALGSDTSKYGQAVDEMSQTVVGKFQLLTNSYMNFLKVYGETLSEVGVFDAISSGISIVTNEVNGLTRAMEYYKSFIMDKKDLYTALTGGVEPQDFAKLTTSLVSGIKGKDLATVQKLQGELGKLEGYLNQQKSFNGMSYAEWVTYALLGPDGDQATKDLLDMQKILRSIGVDVNKIDLSDPKQLANVQKLLKTYMEAAEARRAALQGQRGGKDVTLPDVAELKTKEKILNDIPKILEGAMSAEERYKLSAQAVNEEFDKRASLLRQLIQEDPENRVRWEKDLAKVQENRLKVLKAIKEEEAGGLTDIAEKAKKEKDIAKWRTNGNIIFQGEKFGVPRSAQESVAELVAEYERLRVEAPHALTPEVVEKYKQALRDLAANAKQVSFDKLLQSFDDQYWMSEQIAKNMKEGMEYEQAKALAEIQILVQNEKLTAEQQKQLEKEQKLAQAKQDQVEHLKRVDEWAKKINEEFDLSKRFKQDFQEIAEGARRGKVGIEDAGKQMQKLLFDALGVQEALDFSSSKIDFSSIGDSIQQAILSKEGEKDTQLLGDIRGFLKGMVDEQEGFDWEAKFDRLIDAIKRQKGVAG